MTRVLLIGATGLVGQGVLRQALQGGGVEQVSGVSQFGPDVIG